MERPDREILARLQTDFPLTPHPFDDIGGGLGLSGDDVIRRIEQLKDRGIVRLIGPVLDARRLGYVTTLVAMRVAPDRLERGAVLLREDPGVSHAYEREHSLNLWFTLAARGADALVEEIARIAAAIPAETSLQLPALKLYKIGAFFGTDGRGEAGGGPLPGALPISPEDAAVINRLQQDMPLVRRPFGELCRGTGLDEERFLERCRSLLERGLMRRYGAAVNHRSIGYAANAMACWRVSPERIDEAGRHLASFREVSHCYERGTAPEWPYNLYAMIHGRERETCLALARKASVDLAIEEPLVLFSSAELKKTRVRYQV